MKLMNHLDDTKTLNNDHDIIIEQIDIDSSNKLRVLEDKFYKIFDLNPCPMSISDLDNKIVDVNDAFLRALDIRDKNSILNKELSNKILDKKHIEKASDEIIKNGNIKDYVCSFKTNRGKKIKGLFSGTVIMFNNKPHLLMMCQIINTNCITRIFKTYLSF